MVSGSRSNYPRYTVAISRRERCFDLVLLILLAPAVAILGALIAIAVYIDSPGPVIFRAIRVGRDGRLFEMLKFRKMRVDSSGDPLTLADDARFTPLGRFLANTRLDELPQVWNVLRGEMRLIGPRPELECFVQEFADQYKAILTVTPGITGPAQLRFVNEKSLLHGDDSVVVYREHVLPQKILIDLDYASAHSLARDLSILARTVALPFDMFAALLRTRSAALRAWLPAAGVAIVLLVLFVLSSSNVS